VLNYPLFLDALAYNWPQEGFNAVSGQFNGLQELLKRKDAGTSQGIICFRDMRAI